VKARLRNPHTGDRQPTIELDGLSERSIDKQSYRIASEPGPYYMGDVFQMLRDLGFDPIESVFMIAWVVDDHSLSELPEVLHISRREVNRLHRSVKERMRKLSASNLRLPRDFAEFGHEV
jgi:hypothetical protein